MNQVLQSKRSSLLASLATQNSTLRICLIVAGGVCCVLIVALFILAFRDPLVVGLTPSGPTTLILHGESYQLTSQDVKAFVFDLIEKKFPKEPNRENLMKVCKYLTEGPKAACEKELISKKTFIPQDVVIQELTWNDHIDTAEIKIKRFANFAGTISSIEGNLLLKLTRRARTAENPWGIFVESWKEEVKQ